MNYFEESTPKIELETGDAALILKANGDTHLHMQQVQVSKETTIGQTLGLGLAILMCNYYEMMEKIICRVLKENENLKWWEV